MIVVNGFDNYCRLVSFIRNLVCLPFFLLLFSNIYGQEHVFDINRLATKDGLANLMTSTIYKDQQERIWIGTSYGLNTYDGLGFKLFTKEKNALHSSKDIINVKKYGDEKLWLLYGYGTPLDSPHGNYWVKKISAIDIFDLQAEWATPIEKFLSKDLPFEIADAFLPEIIDEEDRLWICTIKGELFLYSKGQFEKIFQRNNTLFKCLTIDAEENIWLSSQDSLFSIDILGNVIGQLKLPGIIRGVWTGENQTIWIATSDIENQRMQFWSKSENLLKPFKFTRNGLPIAVSSAGTFVHLNEKGNWFLLDRNGFNLFNQQGEWLINYDSLLDNHQIIRSVMDYFETNDDLWLSSANGVFEVKVKSNPFLLIQKKKTKLSDCRNIIEDDKGNILFLNSDVFLWETHTQKCTKIANTKDAAYGLIYLDSIIWAGTYGREPMGFQLNMKTNEKTEYATFDSEKFIVFSVLKTQIPHRFLVGLNHGLAYLDLKKQKLLPLEKNEDCKSDKDILLENSDVNFIHENSAGLWLATSNGIFLMNKENKAIVQHYDKASEDLPHNYIRHIHEDKDGIFWLATKGGGIVAWCPPPSYVTKKERKNLPFFKKTEKKYRQFTTEDGLSHNYTYAVYEDEYNKLWIPSDYGLMHMDKTSLRVRTFTMDDGLPHNEFNQTAHYQSSDGTLYFGGLGGMISFHPRVFEDEDYNSTSLVITACYALNDRSDEMVDHTASVQKKKIIDISPSDKLIELHFTLLDLKDVKQHRYAYQIEGEYNDNWNHIEESYLRIANLPYGNYTLKIKGQNINRGWSDKELLIKIHVLKPFYLKWWFILFEVIIGVGLITGAVFFRINKLKERKVWLEAEIQKRTQQLEEKTIQLSKQNLRIKADKQIILEQAESLKKQQEVKNQIFSNVTHELRTPLTLIIGPLEQMIEESTFPSAFKKRTNSIIKNAEHLLNLINQMLDLAKLEGGRMGVKMTHGDIVAYTNEIVYRFQPMLQKSQLRLSFITPLSIWDTHFDKDKWDKILSNLLSNAIKFTNSGRDIQVALFKVKKEEKDFIRLEVKDAGIGIEEKHLPYIFDRFYQQDGSFSNAYGGTGIGLALVKELVDLQGGEIQVVSETGNGTSFTIYLPLMDSSQSDQLRAGNQYPVFIPEHAYTAPLLPSVPVSSNNPKSKLELLLIEDNEEMLEYIRYCIDDSKYNITEACNGEEGFQKAQALIPDLIVSDIMMPEKDGYELTSAIRNDIATSHIPLILLTAKTSLESRLHGLQRGADAYLTKPFSPEELRLRIQKLIEIRNLLQKRFASSHAEDRNDQFQQENEFISNLRIYILENILDTDLSGDRIGRHFELSRMSLHRKIKALTGHSISEFVRLVRLQKAQELIQENQLNVTEVAYETGFSSIQHFSRSFKKAYGQSPSDFKKQL